EKSFPPLLTDLLPLIEGESSFLFSSRYFWLGALLPSLSRRYKANLNRNGEASYQLYDLNFKLSHRISPRDRIQFSFYKGVDDLSNSADERDTITVLSPLTTLRYAIRQANETNIRWGNTVGAIHWNHLFSDRLFTNFRLTYSNLDLHADFIRQDSTIELFVADLNLERGSLASGLFQSDIEQIGLAVDGRWQARTDRELRFGLGVNFHEFHPRILGSTTEPILVDEVEADNFKDYAPREINGYLEYVIRKPTLQFRGGFRLQSWVTNDGGSYFNILPRLLLSTRIHPRIVWQTTFDATVQSVHLLGSATIGLPTDVWVPSNRNVRPSEALQLSSSLQYAIQPNWELELAAYAKRMEDLVLYQGTTNITGDWENRVSSGEGEAYGLEFTLRRRRGKFRGWISYTLASTTRQFDEQINLGRSFPYRYDRRHSINAMLIWQLGRQSTLNVSWRFGTGAAYSFSLESFQLPPEVDSIYTGPPSVEDITSERNRFRLPPNHRLDINWRFTLRTKATSPFRHSFDIGLYNVYDRHNPIFYELRTDYRSGSDKLLADRSFVQVFIAPLLPIFSYQLHWKGRKQQNVPANIF
ncbi:MAG: hypothetical protein AAFU03_11715, partial [Bacteroidota bacterium]